MAIQLLENLELARCPHCNIANPYIFRTFNFETNNANNTNLRRWSIYLCKSCGGVISGVCKGNSNSAIQIFPELKTVDSFIPDKPRRFLEQAQESIHTPAGCVMLAASSIDSMLKDKGYKEGSLFARIDKAANEHLITEGMKEWAHQIRIEANDQRHADEDFPLPNEDDARRILDFAFALGEFLYVLPAKVQRGIETTRVHVE